jgi:glycosyltransferase involved in cell wall biosynthesis
MSIRVDVVYPGSLNSNIGPSQTMRRLDAAKEVFIKHNISLNIFCKQKPFSNLSNKITQLSKYKNYFLNNVLFYTLKNELSILFFVLKYIKRKTDSEVVVFHHITSFYFYCVFSKKSKKIILFQHNEGDPFKIYETKFPSLKKSVIYSFFKKKIVNEFNKVDKFIFISNYGKKNFDILYPKYYNKTITISNGISDKVFNKIYNPNKIIKLITVGTVSYRKGQNIIIESLSKLPSNLKLNYHLTIVGDGPQFEEFVKLSEKLNVSENITFVGPKKRDEVDKYLLLSDVFILMSNSEGLPLSILEAIRFGLPVITTNIAGCPEPVSNNNGFIISPNSNELSNILSSLKIDSLIKMSKNSRELFKKEYNFESFLEKYIDLITRV